MEFFRMVALILSAASKYKAGENANSVKASNICHHGGSVPACNDLGLPCESQSYLVINPVEMDDGSR